jgi:hypothetical protein
MATFILVLSMEVSASAVTPLIMVVLQPLAVALPVPVTLPRYVVAPMLLVSSTFTSKLARLLGVLPPNTQVFFVP